MIVQSVIKIDMHIAPGLTRSKITDYDTFNDTLYGISGCMSAASPAEAVIYFVLVRQPMDNAMNDVRIMREAPGKVGVLPPRRQILLRQREEAAQRKLVEGRRGCCPGRRVKG